MCKSNLGLLYPYTLVSLSIPSSRASSKLARSLDKGVGVQERGCQERTASAVVWNPGEAHGPLRRLCAPPESENRFGGSGVAPFTNSTAWRSQGRDLLARARAWSHRSAWPAVELVGGPCKVRPGRPGAFDRNASLCTPGAPSLVFSISTSSVSARPPGGSPGERVFSPYIQGRPRPGRAAGSNVCDLKATVLSVLPVRRVFGPASGADRILALAQRACTTIDTGEQE